MTDFKGTKMFILGMMVILNTMYGKTFAGRNAYATNIKTCLFDHWGTSVLATTPTCAGTNQVPLCYAAASTSSSTASNLVADFISCYNNGTLIPDYTAHMLAPITASGLSRPKPSPWEDDTGPYKPVPASTIRTDYASAGQTGFPNYNDKTNAFLSRGHYVNSADFNSMLARELTFINTNVAPQWQLNNCGNWCNLEQAIDNYVNALTSGTKKMYIFTGTDGQAKSSSSGSAPLSDLKLRNVVVPQYFWKAVCHPNVGSIVFYMVNNVGDVSTTKSTTGCNSISQTSKNGIIECDSITAAKASHATFMLPDFAAKECIPGTKGTFLDAELTKKLK